MEIMLFQTIFSALVVSMTLMSGVIYAFNAPGETWSGSQVNISVNIDGNSVSGTSWNQGVNQAISSWNNGMNGFKVISQQTDGHPCSGYLPAFSSDYIPEDFQNSVGFFPNDCGIPFGSGVLAITNTIYSSISNEIVEADIVFNANVPWDIYHGSDRVLVTDFRRVAVHELGHFVGLGHENVAPAIMAPFIANIETPTVDDLAGANFLYPENTIPDPDALIVLLEEPSTGGIGSGVSNIRGWAVANTGIERIELFLDGVFLSDVPL